jgi:hypothetical protein
MDIDCYLDGSCKKCMKTTKPNGKQSLCRESPKMMNKKRMEKIKPLKKLMIMTNYWQAKKSKLWYN